MKMRTQLLVLLAFLCGQLLADEVSVSATLSSPTVEVGEELTLEVRVSGNRKAEPPQEIQVDGLDVTYLGQSQQFQTSFVNGSLSSVSSIVFNYSIIPQKAGRFMIPALEISAGSKIYKTEALQLNVGGSAEQVEIAFAEIVSPKRELFLGEAIPVELRFYLDAQVRGELEQAPSLSAEGFTTQKFDKPTQNQVTRNGRTYHSVTFKLALTPVKTGKLTLGPAKMEGMVQLRSKKRRADPGFGAFPGFEDFFANQMQPPRRIVLEAKPFEINVKPLPAGAPAGFSGAVGQFAFTSEASPLSVKVGDPITLKMKISGRGNLDRVAAPKLDQSAGWKSYPPTSKIEPDDDLGISGTKSFEMALVPELQHTEAPQLSFSYFDPVAAEYKVLKSAPIALAVAPNGVASAPVVMPTVEPSAPPQTAENVASDILYIQDELNPSKHSVVPLYLKKEFWALQSIPALCLLALGALLRKRKANGSQELRRRRKSALKAVEGATTQGELYEAAVNCLQLIAAAPSARVASAIDAEAACELLGICGQAAQGIHSIFESAAALRYSGSAQILAPASKEERCAVLETLNALEETHAHR